MTATNLGPSWKPVFSEPEPELPPTLAAHPGHMSPRTGPPTHPGHGARPPAAAHPSPPVVAYSPRIAAHPSPPMAHPSPAAAHPSPPAAHASPPMVHPSQLAAAAPSDISMVAAHLSARPATVPTAAVPPSPVSTPVPPVLSRPGPPGPARVEPVDRAVITLLRARVAERLVSASQPGADHDDLRARGRAVIEEVLREYTVEAVADGSSATWSPDLRRRTAQALFDEVFGLGRLQPLVDQAGVENILIRGADYVRLQLADGSKVRGPAVADDDEDLVRFLQWLSTRPGTSSARPFSWSAPKLHMKLAGGARLAATAFVVDRPTVNVRLHRLVVDTLDGWVSRGCMTAACASFLGAAVRAEWSVVVAGPMNSGKTTLVRALCAQIPRDQLIGTFETEYELFLGETGQHDEVIPWEARPGMGEIGADGRPAGEFTLEEALMDSFRFSLDRAVVGEVRGPEAAVMVKAMESGTGVLSTTHSADASAALHKLAGCAAESGLMDTGLGLAKLSRCLN
ncbi:MAG: Flp pilus assembly complex ATPase component TadA, partial [Micrococcales bacterium]|nr:Flp pilus assembly complex ATPase component TadA [Micrococcales bacterium]